MILIVSFDLQGTLTTADNSAIRPEVVAVADSLTAAGISVVILTAIHQDHFADGMALVANLAARLGLSWEIVPAIYSAATPLEVAKAAAIRDMGILLHFDDLPVVVDYINQHKIALAVRV